MTISFGALGTAGVGFTSIAPSFPTGMKVGDMLVLCVANKYPSNGPSTPSGWTLAGQATGGQGVAGSDAGNVYSTVFYREVDGTESGSVTVTITSGNTARGCIVRYTKSGAKSWAVATTQGASNTAGTAWSATADADPGILGDDMVLCVSAVNGNVATDFTAQAMTATGLTMGTEAQRADGGTTNGDDVHQVVSDHFITSGTSAAAPVFTMTADTTSGDTPAGGTVFFRLREVAVPGFDLIPTWQAVGTLAEGQGDISPAWPTHVAGDIGILLVESANEAISLGVPAGFVELTNSPQGTGTPADTAATALAVYWCRATSDSMTAPTVTDPGNHAFAIIHTFRDCLASGTPWGVTAGGTGAADNDIVCPAITTTFNRALVVLVAARSTDASSAQQNTMVNANLTTIVERSDSGTLQGNGGGIGLVHGYKIVAGDTGTSTTTLSTGGSKGYLTFEFLPTFSPTEAVGTAAGTSTVDGFARAIIPVAGTAAGTSTASGTSDFTLIESDPYPNRMITCSLLAPKRLFNRTVKSFFYR